MNQSIARMIWQSMIAVAPFAITMLAAGTLRFWPGWLFWGVFTLSSIATGIYFRRRDPALLARRMRFGPIAEPRRSQRLIIFLILAMFFAIAIVAGCDYRFGWFHLPAAIIIAANLLIAGVFVFFIEVMRENTFAASTITIEPGQRVITTGLYARVRHPMYAGALIMVLVMPLALGSVAALPIAAFSIPLLRARILDEERALSAELPGYDDYRRTVLYRLIPMVW